MNANEYAKSRGIAQSTIMYWIRKGQLAGAWSRQGRGHYEVDAVKADECVKSIGLEIARKKAERIARREIEKARLKAAKKAERVRIRLKKVQKKAGLRNPFCEHYSKCLSKAAFAKCGSGKLDCHGCQHADIRPVDELTEIKIKHD